MAITHVWDREDETRKQESRARLLRLFPVGSSVNLVEIRSTDNGTIYKVLATEANSTRITAVSMSVARVCGLKICNKSGGVYVSGHNISPSGWLVYILSRSLHSELGDRAGYALTENTI